MATRDRRRRPTIADVASLAGVSKGAVSFALNGGPGVSEDTRQRIIRAADELSWRPSSAARALSRAQVDTIGLVLNRPMRTLGSEPFFNQFLSGLSVALAEHGRSLHMFIVDNSADELATYRHWWEQRQVDGFVIMDPVADDPRIGYVVAGKIPAVVVGPPRDADGLSTVWSDDAVAMRRCIEHLVDLGHRRIWHVGGSTGLRHVDRRATALTERVNAGALDRGITVATDFTENAAATITARLVSSADRPTAVIYDSDLMALAGLGVVLDAGLRVPDDLSILSFDDSPMVRLAHPAITALGRDTFEFGATVGNTLDAVIRDGRITQVESPTPRLEVRSSTGRPPSRAQRGEPHRESDHETLLLPTVQETRATHRPETHRGAPQPPKRIVIGADLDPELRELAEMLATELAHCGAQSAETVVSTDSPGAGDLELRLVDDDSAGSDPEAYLISDGSPVVVSARTVRGLFWATRTLLQAIGQDAPLGSVADWPGYPERAVLLDIGRKYFSPEWICWLIRQMSYLKLNTLQLHVSEGTGFGIECRSHPEINTGRTVLSRAASTADI